MGRGMSKRGTSMQFGPDVTERFCKQNNIDYIIRSHEVKEKGWERQHNGRCWTIFSGKFFNEEIFPKKRPKITLWLEKRFFELTMRIFGQLYIDPKV